MVTQLYTLHSTWHNRSYTVNTPSVRNSIGIGSSIGISHRSSSLCLGGYRSSSYRDGVGMGSIGVSIGQHWSSYCYRLFMHIGLSFNIFMYIGLSSYFMSFYRLLMDIRLSRDFFHSILWLNMNIGLGSNIFMHIWLSSYFLMDIRNNCRDVLILRSRCTKHCGCCGKENLNILFDELVKDFLYLQRVALLAASSLELKMSSLFLIL